MALNYNNPNDWGRSPLTDNALRLQQFRAENPEKWDAMIRDDLNALSVDTEEEPYPPFTGQEFIDNHETIEDHPYAFAFSQLLGRGVPANTANELAFGINNLHEISDDIDDPLRMSAWQVYDYCCENDYWRNSGETDQEPENFNFDNGGF